MARLRTRQLKLALEILLGNLGYSMVMCGLL